MSLIDTVYKISCICKWQCHLNCVLVPAGGSETSPVCTLSCYFVNKHTVKLHHVVGLSFNWKASSSKCLNWSADRQEVETVHEYGMTTNIRQTYSFFLLWPLRRRLKAPVLLIRVKQHATGRSFGITGSRTSLNVTNLQIIWGCWTQGIRIKWSTIILYGLKITASVSFVNRPRRMRPGSFDSWVGREWYNYIKIGKKIQVYCGNVLLNVSIRKEDLHLL